MGMDFANELILLRDTRQLSQRQFGEMFELSRQMISLYECGEALPSEDVVLRIIDTFGCRRLGYARLASGKLGEIILPPLPEYNLATNILKLQVALTNVASVQSEIIDIGADGIIDKHEETRWQKCMIALRDLTKAIFPVQMAAKGKSTASTVLR